MTGDRAACAPALSWSVGQPPRTWGFAARAWPENTGTEATGSPRCSRLSQAHSGRLGSEGPLTRSRPTCRRHLRVGPELRPVCRASAFPEWRDSPPSTAPRGLWSLPLEGPREHHGARTRLCASRGCGCCSVCLPRAARLSTAAEPASPSPRRLLRSPPERTAAFITPRQPDSSLPRTINRCCHRMTSGC